MPFPLIPVAIGGVLLASITALRIRKVSKDKKAKNVVQAQEAVRTAPAAAPTQAASVTPAQVAAAATNAGVTVPQLQQAAAAAGTTPQAIIASANAAGSSVADDIIRQLEANPAAAAAAPALPPVLQGNVMAVVTTNDPAPSGDLIIRSSPSASAPQIGGAEKNGTVIVLDSSDATFARIQWGGGSRLPAATGFARKAFLKTV